MELRLIAIEWQISRGGFEKRRIANYTFHESRGSTRKRSDADATGPLSFVDCGARIIITTSFCVILVTRAVIPVASTCLTGGNSFNNRTLETTFAFSRQTNRDKRVRPRIFRASTYANSSILSFPIETGEVLRRY